MQLTATSGASWVTISNGTGRIGSGSVSFTATANTTAAPRSATLTVAGHFRRHRTERIVHVLGQPGPHLIPSTAATATLTVTTQAGWSLGTRRRRPRGLR
jgi:hypothetical protein